jgi:hypothetical protein
VETVSALSSDGKEKDLGWSAGRFSALQQKFEGSLVGEAVISGLAAVILVTCVVWNLPNSAIKAKFMPIITPIALAASLDQGWQMFAPDPPARLDILVVHVTMSNGTERIWTFKPGDKLVGSFRWYHWQKLREAAVWQKPSQQGFAHYMARELAGPSERPARIIMVLRQEPLPAPGSSAVGAPTEQTIYDEVLP